ncbi:MAG: hypothetical protein HDS62_07595 [Bacteroidales bacterium]|nr:hypothetical protein [Bacteroidales bacterium]
MKHLLLILLALLIAGILSSCRTRYIPVESVRTEYIATDTSSLIKTLSERFRAERASEKSRDSVIDKTTEKVTLRENGDTAKVIITRYVKVTSDREREMENIIKEQRDSIRELMRESSYIRTDTIRVPYPVEKKLSFKEKAGYMAKGTIATVLILAVLNFIAWIVRRSRKM